ncbi:MAG: peroxiredoxin [Myxococcota bacterium]
MLKVGDRVGAFEAESSTGRPIKLDELSGRAFVAFFFPKSFTPGCTLETRNFAGAYPEFQELGVEVVGISADTTSTQCSFADTMGASFPMVGDKSGDVARAFEMRKGLMPMYKRVTFVIDEQGVVERVFKVGFGIHSHAKEVLDYMRARTA